MPLGASRWVRVGCLVNTFASSWANPIAATPGRPVWVCAARSDRIFSILRSVLVKPHHRMRSSSAKRLTAFRNAVWSKTAGDGIRIP